MYYFVNYDLSLFCIVIYVYVCLVFFFLLLLIQSHLFFTLGYYPRLSKRKSPLERIM